MSTHPHAVPREQLRRHYGHATHLGASRTVVLPVVMMLRSTSTQACTVYMRTRDASPPRAASGQSRGLGRHGAGTLALPPQPLLVGRWVLSWNKNFLTYVVERDTRTRTRRAIRNFIDGTHIYI